MVLDFKTSHTCLDTSKFISSLAEKLIEVFIDDVARTVNKTSSMDALIGDGHFHMP